MIEKLIITNGAVLKKKYDAGGWKAIQLAVSRLAAVDALRGITTTLALLDKPGPGVKSVSTPGSRKQCKDAIDALYARHDAPDYVLLLGGPDVVPHQSLINPVYAPYDLDGDHDKDVPSDLPYACDAPYSRRIDDFLGPTRVVGRLPDLPGAKDPAALIQLIDNAATFNGTPKGTPFAITAEAWKNPTAASTRLALGKAAPMGVSPADGPNWPAKRLQAPVHFINCHGVSSNWRFYGDPGDFPVAHEPGPMKGLVPKGAIVVVECCYGAEIYRPTKTIPPGLAYSYLQEGAAAYCGSTNVAYGGEHRAANRCMADILCTDFLKAVVNKATTGRALLQARQDYILTIDVEDIDPVDLKTIAQFLLLGDPSLRPYPPKTEPIGKAPLSKSVIKAARAGFGNPTVLASKRFASAHRNRRAILEKRGAALETNAPTLKRAAPRPVDQHALNQWALRRGLSTAGALTFEVRTPRTVVATQAVAKGAKMKGIKMKGGAGPKQAPRAGDHIHLIFDTVDDAPQRMEAPTSLADLESLTVEAVLEPVDVADPQTLGGQVLAAPTRTMKFARQVAVRLDETQKAPVRRIGVWIIRSSGGKVLSYRRATSR